MKTTLSRLLGVAIAVVLAVGAGGCGGDDDTSPGSATPAPADPTPSVTEDPCTGPVQGWVVAVDAFAEATTLDDPTQTMVSKVIDAGEDAAAGLTDPACAQLAVGIESSNRAFERVSATITACDFVELGCEVDDEVDAALATADEARGSLSE